MKITILANKELASNYAINLLIPHLLDHDISIFLSSQVGKNNKKPNQLNTLTFFEQDLFNDLLSPLLVNSTVETNQFKSFTQLNAYTCQDIEELNVINTAEGIAKVKVTQPELILCIRYGSILKDEILSIPQFGVLNLHSGLLPNYRGVMATFWAMLNDETSIGTTLHYINDASIDTGEIIATSSFSVEKNRSYLWHVLQLYKGGCELFVAALSTIAAGNTVESARQPKGGHYYTFPTEKDLLAFNQKGFLLVNEKEVTDFLKTHYTNTTKY